MGSFGSLAKMINAATKTKTEPDDFLSMYSEAKRRLAVPRKPSPCYHPSSMGGCSRNLYFQLTRTELDDDLYADSQLMEIGDSGTDRHLRIQTTISQMAELGYPVEWVDISDYLSTHPHLGTEVKKIDGLETLLYNSIFNLSFKCDGIIKYKGLLRILEIKTEVEMKWIARNSPVPEHVDQAIAYSLGLGIEDVLFVYENRNVCSKKAYLCTINKIEKDRMIEKIARIDGFLADEKIPPKEESVSNCKYCHYKTECVKW